MGNLKFGFVRVLLQQFGSVGVLLLLCAAASRNVSKEREEVKLGKE